jgi:hypothetical protein
MTKGRSSGVLVSVEIVLVFAFFFVPEVLFYSCPRLPIYHNLYFSDLNSIYYTSLLVANGHPPELVNMHDYWLPLPYYLNAVGLLLFGKSVLGLYVVSAAASGVQGVIFFGLLREFISRRLTYLILPFFTFFTAKVANLGYAAMYTAVFALASSWVFVRYIRCGGWKRLAGAGLLLGLAYCCKFEITTAVLAGNVFFLLFADVFQTSLSGDERSMEPAPRRAHLVSAVAASAIALAAAYFVRERLNLFVLAPISLLATILLLRAFVLLVWPEKDTDSPPPRLAGRLRSVGLLLAGFFLPILSSAGVTWARTDRSFGLLLEEYVPFVKLPTLFRFAGSFTQHFDNINPFVFLDVFPVDHRLLFIGVLALAASALLLLSHTDTLRRMIDILCQAFDRHPPAWARAARYSLVVVTSVTLLAAYGCYKVLTVANVESAVFYMLLIAAVHLLVIRGGVLNDSQLYLLVAAAFSFTALLRSIQTNFVYQWLFLPLAIVFFASLLAPAWRAAQRGAARWTTPAYLIGALVVVGVFSLGQLRYQRASQKCEISSFYSCRTEPAKNRELTELQTFLNGSLTPQDSIFVLSCNKAPYVLAGREYAPLPSFLTYYDDEEAESLRIIEEDRPKYVIGMNAAPDDIVGLRRVRQLYPRLVSRVLQEYATERQIGKFIIMARRSIGEATVKADGDESTD